MIKEYKQSIKELNKLYEIEDKNKENHNEKRSKIQIKYWKLEAQLRNKREIETEIVSKKLEEKTSKIEKQREPHKERVIEFKRIMSFIEINKKEHDLKNFRVYKYDYPQDKKGEVIRTKDGNYPEKQQIDYKEFDTLKNNPYLILKVFVTENRKPLNKFSLVVVGNTFFNEDVINIPYSYGLDCQDSKVNVRVGIKDFPTEKEAQEYYKRNYGKILIDFRTKHVEIEAEYQNAISKTQNNKDWEIAYLEHQKEYYENNWSGYEEEEEYKQIVKDLKRLVK